jgi:hypothetical protein
MLKKGDNVIIDNLPPGRKLPESLKGEECSVIDMHRYGSSFFYDIELLSPVEGIDKLPLFRGNLLRAVAPRPSNKELQKAAQLNREAEISQSINELKDELKAWPLPKQFDENSEMYNRVWVRRMRLHGRIATMIKELGGKV